MVNGPAHKRRGWLDLNKFNGSLISEDVGMARMASCFLGKVGQDPAQVDPGQFVELGAAVVETRDVL